MKLGMRNDKRRWQKEKAENITNSQTDDNIETYIILSIILVLGIVTTIV